MVFIRVHGFDPERRVFLHCCVEGFLEFREHIGFEYLPTIFRAPNNVKLMLVGGVADVTNPHVTSLPYEMT